MAIGRTLSRHTGCVGESGGHLRLGWQVWEDICNGEAVRDPARLGRFSVLCFADIKRNAFVYWCVGRVRAWTWGGWGTHEYAVAGLRFRHSRVRRCIAT
jgi:hypothetical protein